jgi:hypothetical protein
MTSTRDGDDNRVVPFPPTDEERRALRKAKQELERQRLIRCFVDEAGTEPTLFHTRDGVAFADLIIEGHRETWPVRSKPFRHEYIQYIRREWERHADQGELLALTIKPTLKKAAINAAIDDFEMRAICSRFEREVHVRVAADGDDLYIDLCDRDWSAVRITSAGWSVIQAPPVRFRRARGMLALPFPERGSSIDALRPFLNINSESDFILIVAFLLAALQPLGPYPICVIIGEQGTAKTSFVKLLRALTDPSETPTVPLPASGRDLFIAAANSHVQAFENISKISAPMSDHLCRLATGGAFRTRALFEDTDETLLRATRPVMMEGIVNFVTHGDLMGRSLILRLEPLSDRKTERSLWAEFERLRPHMFGALLDHLVTGVRRRHETHLVHPPRMADFAHWSVACGLDTFEEAYAQNRQAAIDTLLEHNVLARALRAFVQEEWTGTASELLDELGPAVRFTNPRALADEVDRLAPLLRTVGLDIRHLKRRADRREIRIIYHPPGRG